jgi:DNA-directed RNA polymerase specialized sigma24 family protein
LVAATMKEIGAGLGRLGPEDRALLDLSMRRGMSDDDIAGVLRCEPGEVSERREALLEQLADMLELSGRDQRDELRATLPDLPPEIWSGSGA